MNEARSDEAVKARIILADGDSDSRTMVVAALRRDGHQVLEAVDGSHALEILSASLGRQMGFPSEIDLILAEVRMPGRSGLDLLDAVKKVRRPPPVILLTAFGADEVHREARSAGAAATLEKPVDLEDLRTMVGELLRREASDQRSGR